MLPHQASVTGTNNTQQLKPAATVDEQLQYQHSNSSYFTSTTLSDTFEELLFPQISATNELYIPWPAPDLSQDASIVLHDPHTRSTIHSQYNQPHFTDRNTNFASFGQFSSLQNTGENGVLPSSLSITSSLMAECCLTYHNRRSTASQIPSKEQRRSSHLKNPQTPSPTTVFSTNSCLVASVSGQPSKPTCSGQFSLPQCLQSIASKRPLVKPCCETIPFTTVPLEQTERTYRRLLPLKPIEHISIACPLFISLIQLRVRALALMQLWLLLLFTKLLSLSLLKWIPLNSKSLTRTIHLPPRPVAQQEAKLRKEREIIHMGAKVFAGAGDVGNITARYPFSSSSG